MADENEPREDLPTNPGAETPPERSDFGWSAAPPPPADPFAESTRILPPFPESGPAATIAPVRRPTGLAAAVLAGSILLGGAAGVGGAAWYDAWQGKPAGTTVNSSTPVTATGVSAPAGSAEKVAAAVLPSVVKINVSGSGGAGSGSGIVLSADGNILTNNHVVELAGNGGSITVNFNDGNTVRAKVVGTDPVTDIAVIHAEGVSGLTPATIGKSSGLQVGQSVVAVGSPYGLNATVTAGIVSALNRPVSVSTSEQQTPQFPGFGFGEQQQQQQSAVTSTTYPAIQTDAAINPGNSGGPLVDMNGNVVGINSSIRTADTSSLTGTGGSIGLGFAIPIDEVLPIINQILHGEQPTHARLAITVSDVASNALTQGAEVQDVQSGGPADQAGLRKGDVITQVGAERIDGSESLVATIRGHRPGDVVKLTVQRGGKTQTITATLGSDAQTTQS